MRGRAARLAGALAAAALALAAFVRTRDPDTHVCVAWPERTVRWTLDPDRAFSSPSCDAEAVGAAAAAAFAAWSQATPPGAAAPCTDLQLVPGGASRSAVVGYDRGGANENLVVFRRGFCGTRVPAQDPCWDDGTCGNAYDCLEDGGPGDAYVIALTTVTYDAGDGRILDADVEVADWDGEGTALAVPSPHGWYLTCGDDLPLCDRFGEAGCTGIDLRNTLTHEVGHVIGLAHVPRTPENRGSTMYPEATPGDVSKRDLAPDDVAGVCTVYPAGAPTPACAEAARHDGGCATAGGDGAGLAAAAALAARALARRRLRTR